MTLRVPPRAAVRERSSARGHVCDSDAVALAPRLHVEGVMPNLNDKIDRAARSAKNAASKAGAKVKSASKAAGDAVKGAGRKIKRGGKRAGKKIGG